VAKQVHHATRKAAEKDLAEGVITEQSHAAVIAGEMDLATARNIGVDDTPTYIGRATEVQGGGTGIPGRASAGQDGDTPPQPVSRISKNDRSRPCLCGCQQYTAGGLFRIGHDTKMFRIAREHLTEGRDLSDEQREYLEESGKLERVKARLAEEEQKRQGKDARKGKK
jgi:hypothetical protein